MMRNGLEKEEIINIVSKKNFISKNDIDKKVKESFLKLQEHEMNVDIKISDYIENNYRKKQLFYSPNHPVEDLLLEYCNRILTYMGFSQIKYQQSDLITECITLKGQDIPIYPSVINCLGLKEYETRFYINRYVDSELVGSFHEYIELYYYSNNKCFRKEK